MTIILFFFACTAPIDIETDDSPPVVVIYGVLTDELKYQEVKVSRSSPYFDNEPNSGISGAYVTVRSSDNTVYPFLESDSIPGLYYSQSEFGAQIGMDYFLTVEVDFNIDGIMDKYEAETTILPVPAIDSLTIEPVEMFGHKNHILYVHAQDPPEKNFYLFNVFHNDSLLTQKLADLPVSDDELFNDQYIKGDIYFFDDISEWEKDTEETRKRSVYLQPGDKIDLQLGLISQGYFDFINQCRSGKNGENPLFGGPASNIATNISNGGVGYFAGYAISRKSIVFE
ncbi:hypothetical protein FACS189432_07360 [Bacteroidia bacterium]|nr:hypothetical protein FACS189426_19350 [Bacteroidia bacterium]GHT28842.1 hypothetical protein FACS189432_07360 [Bacteroidia bacterium]